ncbi:LLM class flavin-dependent oxidoreductase [Nocardia sp. NPDC088792]|uniref:LLM class flavin-dependent oxidoreductase n=1 Tax=Nocardia sp. NPDC088792 TaxID=3364332 RepID=UPI0037F1D0F0
MTSTPRLSILDATPISAGVPAEQALRWTTQVAQAAEILGYHRLWVVEHHAMPTIGGSAPAVLIAHLAANTATLRIGSGGVMLPNHPPLVIAEQFSTLHALYPDRIDLGIGRANGAPPAALKALRSDSEGHGMAAFAGQLDDLTGFLTDSLPAQHPWANVHISPHTSPPPVYLLGSSTASAAFAGQRGMPFAFAHHLTKELTREALDVYRATFVPSQAVPEPYVMVTVGVVCAATDEHARHAATAATLYRLRAARARHDSRSIDAEELWDPTCSDNDRREADEALAAGRFLVGDSVKVTNGLADLAKTTGANELMLASIEFDGPARIRTLASIATSWPWDKIGLELIHDHAKYD